MYLFFINTLLASLYISSAHNHTFDIRIWINAYFIRLLHHYLVRSLHHYHHSLTFHQNLFIHKYLSSYFEACQTLRCGVCGSHWLWEHNTCFRCGLELQTRLTLLRWSLHSYLNEKLSNRTTPPLRSGFPEAPRTFTHVQLGEYYLLAPGLLFIL